MEGRESEENSQERSTRDGRNSAGRRKKRFERPGDLFLKAIEEDSESGGAPYANEITQIKSDQSKDLTIESLRHQQLPKIISYSVKKVLSPIPENHEYRMRQKVSSPVKELGRYGRMDTPTTKTQTFCF